LKPGKEDRLRARCVEAGRKRAFFGLQIQANYSIVRREISGRKMERKNTGQLEFLDQRKNRWLSPVFPDRMARFPKAEADVSVLADLEWARCGGI